MYFKLFSEDAVVWYYHTILWIINGGGPLCCKATYEHEMQRFWKTMNQTDVLTRFVVCGYAALDLDFSR